MAGTYDVGRNPREGDRPTFTQVYGSVIKREGRRDGSVPVDEAKQLLRNWVNEVRRHLDSWAHADPEDPLAVTRADQVAQAIGVLDAAKAVLLVVHADKQYVDHSQADHGLLDKGKELLWGKPTNTFPGSERGALPKVSVAGLYHYLETVCKELDFMLDLAKPPEVQQMDFPKDMVLAFQNLLQCRLAGSEDNVMEVLDDLVEKLPRHKITVVTDHAQNHGQWFTVHPERPRDGRTVRVVKPALVYDDHQLLAMGEAVVEQGEPGPGGPAGPDAGVGP